MSREIDRRDPTQNRIDDQQGWQQRVQGASRRLSEGVELEIRGWNPDLGTPHRVAIRRTDGALAGVGGPDPTAGLVPGELQADRDYVDAAVAAIQRIPDALGVAGPGLGPGGDAPDAARVELRADPRTDVTSQGARTVTVRQELDGYPIFDSAKTVHFDPNEAITEVVGRNYDVSGQSVPPTPQVSVERAVLLAAEHCAVPDEDELGAVDQFGQPLDPASADLAGFEPSVLAAFSGTRERYTVLEPGPFGAPFKANLSVFPLRPDDMRLAWRVQLTMPGPGEQFDVLVDAEDGALLYATAEGQGLRARGNVFLVDGGGSRRWRPFPEPPESYPVGTDLLRRPTEASVSDWLAEGVATTDGTQVVAESEVESRSALSDWEGTVLGGALGRDDVGEHVEFAPGDPQGRDQQVLNAFYWTNVGRDFFALLGVEDDERLHVRVYPRPITSTAYYVRDSAGRPTLNVGAVPQSDGESRHTALSSNVVFHEFVHHVTTTLVGHPGNVPQAGAMMEGWSDYFACTLNATDVVGPWVLGDPSGLRRHPYDGEYPGDFGDVGREGYRGRYEIGEVWCATLYDLNRIVGDRMGWQLVADSLKITPEHPSLLDGRDAVLRALEDVVASGTVSPDDAYFLRRGVWSAFARHGMGHFARTHGPHLPPTPEVADRYVSASDAAVTDGIVGMAPTPAGGGYWLADADGGTYQHGDAPFYGWLGGSGVEVVDVAATPAGDGYWLVGRDGTVGAFGNAPMLGSARGRPSEAASEHGPVRGIVAHPDGAGYWLYTDAGAVYPFGRGPRFLGSPLGAVEPGSIVACAVAPDGRGYWLADVYGAVYAFGSAPALGDVASGASRPISALAGTPGGQGYLLVDSVGTVYPFGDGQAVFRGGVEGRVPGPVVDLQLTPSGRGYWIVCSGSAPGSPLVHPFGDASDLPERPVGLAEYLQPSVPAAPPVPEPASQQRRDERVVTQ